jgi:hypothetical protein
MCSYFLNLYNIVSDEYYSDYDEYAAYPDFFDYTDTHFMLSSFALAAGIISNRWLLSHAPLRSDTFNQPWLLPGGVSPVALVPDDNLHQASPARWIINDNKRMMS